jgi:2-keto-4-pentenoate hydratase/2-oxohepta-3-ene-1,7-dioic acid hydratase in catechol pathway
VDFHREVELALTIKGPAKKVAQQDWRGAVFGYTGLIAAVPSCA